MPAGKLASFTSQDTTIEDFHYMTNNLCTKDQDKDFPKDFLPHDTKSNGEKYQALVNDHDNGLAEVTGDFDENADLANPEIIQRLSILSAPGITRGNCDVGKEEKQEDENHNFKENWSTTKLLEKYENLRTITLKNMPNLWSGLEFALSIKTILNIKDCTLPFPGIILGPASSLKTVIIELFRGSKHTFYTDNFSPKSLVSHNSAVKKEKLKEIDMLPKIRDKYFLTPELAPIFASRDDDLLQVLGILTRVADGHGYESDSGAQGHRGYNEDIMFVWLGACVDIPYKVHRLLGTLGPKLYFFRLPRIEETEDYYYKTRNENFIEKKQKIRTALLEYLAYFEMNPEIIMEEENGLPKICMDPQKDEELAHRIIIRLAKLLAHLRALVPTWETKDSQGSEYSYTLAKIEDPTRAITQLTNLTRGHALSKGRNYITIDDIPMVIHTALSTATMERVRILDLLIANKGSLKTSQIVDFLNTTKPTALRTMTELKATGLVTMIYDQGEYNAPKEIRLKPEFGWFLSDKFIELKECKEKNPRREPSVSDFVVEEICKENYTPRTPPIFLYDQTITKKLNFPWDDSFHHNDHDGGVHFSLHRNNIFTCHSSKTYICQWCRILHNRTVCYQTSDFLEKHTRDKHPGRTAYPGSVDIKKYEREQYNDVNDVTFLGGSEKNNVASDSVKNAPKTTSNEDTNAVDCPDFQDVKKNIGNVFEEKSQGGDQKGTSLTSSTSSRIYRASWTGDVWACRYCGLKGDKPSLKNHDCPEINNGGKGEGGGAVT